jgi:hypothetical protein
LLAGPATNVTSLTVLLGILGKRATAVYLAAIAALAVICGLVLDQVYTMLGISAQAVAGQAAELIPHWAQTLGAIALLLLSIKPFYRAFHSRFRSAEDLPDASSCRCSSEECTSSEGDHLC